MNKSKQTQIDKYGGVGGYRAEMARRRSLVKKPWGFAVMDKDRLKELSSRGGKNRWKQKDDQTEEGSRPS